MIQYFDFLIKIIIKAIIAKWTTFKQLIDQLMNEYDGCQLMFWQIIYFIVSTGFKYYKYRIPKFQN